MPFARRYAGEPGLNRVVPALAAACFSLAAAVAGAQAPPRETQKPCAQTADPEKCKAKRKELREKLKAAQACKEKGDKRLCAAERYCAKAPDPAKCRTEARQRQEAADRRVDERQKEHEACSGKRGEPLQKCLSEQRQKARPVRPAAKG